MVAKIFQNLILFIFLLTPLLSKANEKWDNLILVAIEQSDGSELWGFIDYTGKEVIKLQYSYGKPFSEGLSLVGDSQKKLGFIDENNKVVIPFQFEYQSFSFSEGLACVKKDGMYGFIDKKGKIIISFQYRYGSNGFHEGLASVGASPTKYGFIDKKGKVVIPLIYQFVLPFSNGLAAVKKDDKWGFINKKGNIIVPIKYYKVKPFSDGLALVSPEYKKVGYIDTSGKLVIPYKYDYGESFRNNSTFVKTGGRTRSDDWGIIDKTGNWIVKFNYPNIYTGYSFMEGLARVRQITLSPQKCGYIDRKGVVVIPIDYQDTLAFRNGFAGAKKNNKWGLIDINNKLIVPYKYDWFIYQNCYY